MAEDRRMQFAGRPLEGRAAIVTGSGRNIGKAIAMALARAGAKVVINGHRNKDLVDQTVEEIRSAGGEAIGVMADVGEPADVERMVAQCVTSFGSVDIAVSNVAIRRVQDFLDISLDDWRTLINSNLNASFYMARTVIPHMKTRRWGRIIHISGNDGFNAHSINRAHNTVCKAGIHTLSRVLSNAFGRDGITINTIAPGRTDTDRDWSVLPSNYVEETLKKIPVGRFADVDEIANMALFLAAKTGEFITGQVLHVNGGESNYAS